MALRAVSVAIAVGYLCGALPWGLWLGRWLRGVDVRRLGSGNLGATNVYRSLGPGIGLLTLALDIAKGALPVWLLPSSPLGAAFPGGAEWCRVAVGLAAIAGHVWTVFAGFRGGKGVATTTGVLLALDPLAFAVFVAVFVAAVAVTRWISLGSILGALAFAVTLATGPGGMSRPTAWFGVIVAALVIVRHRDNIRRLLRGEEPRFSFGGRRRRGAA
jgi:glycerol-3-phosphate acyltransferase PlsY